MHRSLVAFGSDAPQPDSFLIETHFVFTIDNMVSGIFAPGS